MMTEKAQNYTPEQTREIVELYQGGKTPQEIAEATQRTQRSIVAKLSREGVYKSKARTRQLAHPVRKADLISEIAHSIHANEELLESLEKATKEALELIAQAVKPAAVEGQEI